MDQISAHLDRGWDLVHQGDFPGAARSARKCIELDESSAPAHHLLGYALAAEGNAEAALEAYRHAIELDETFVEAMLNAAELLIAPIGSLEEAHALVDDALDYVEGDEEEADAKLIKVDAFLHAGDLDAARRLLATIPEGPFESAAVEFLLGRAKLDVGDAPGAEPHLRRAIEKDPAHADAHYLLGSVLDARGLERDATLSLLRAREADLAYGLPPWAPPNDELEARVASALKAVRPELGKHIDGALVILDDAPGAEVVADGLDPRMTLLLDDVTGEDAERRAGRVFVYRLNLARNAGSAEAMERELVAALEREITFLVTGQAPAELEPAPGSTQAQRAHRPSTDAKEE